MKFSLMLAGLVIVSVLAVYAVILRRKLGRKKQLEQEKVLELEGQAAAQRSRVNKSIQVIAQSIPEGKMTLTEGVMRLSVLLESLGITDADREEFSPIFKLAEATAHIPILEGWKKLPLKKRMAFDQQRQALESDYRDFVLASAKSLVGRVF